MAIYITNRDKNSIQKVDKINKLQKAFVYSCINTGGAPG